MNDTPSADFDACPGCGGTDWAAASDGLGDVASVAAVCAACGYLTTSVIALNGSGS